VNIPYPSVKMALGEEIPQMEPKYGTRMIRYWEEVFITPDKHVYELESYEGMEKI